MSLHRYLVPPPLALAVHPAPPPKPREKSDEKNKKDDKDRTDDKRDDKDRKDDKEDDKNDGKDKKNEKKDDGKGKKDEEKVGNGNKDKEKQIKKDADGKQADKDQAPLSPAHHDDTPPVSPGSMIPEPGTPVHPPETPKDAGGDAGPTSPKAKKRAGKGKKGGDKDPAPKHKLAGDDKVHKDGLDQKAKEKDEPKDKNGDVEHKDEKKKGEGDKDKDIDGKDKDGKDDKEEDEEKKEDEEDAKSLPPIKLLGPAPTRPIRAKLDLNPEIAYPPINTDPRGAYFKYAKAVQREMIYVDVVKDGYLVEQWREKSEREALARLQGETERQRQREVEAEFKKRAKRKVPEESAQILLELWNDLVEAPHNEFITEDFWARYDWTDPEAEAHLAPAKVTPPKDDKEEAKIDGEEGKKNQTKSEVADRAIEKKASEVTDPKAKADGEDEDEEKKPDGADSTEPAASAEGKDKREVAEEEDGNAVQWTKEGLEVTLGTVGVQCSYNTREPLPRHSWEPSGAYIILGHNYFMLRTEDTLQWKPEEAANKFEVLVTTGHDRVFGEMVMAQQMEEKKKKEREYRERKYAEKKLMEEEFKKAKAEGREPRELKELKEEKRREHDEKRRKQKGEKDEKPDGDNAKGDEEPVSPGSNVKVRDGEEVKPVKAEEKVKAAVVKDGKAVIAVPVKGDGLDKKGDDEKHEVEVVAAAPGEAVDLPKKEEKGEKGAKPEREGKDDEKGHEKDEKDAKDGKDGKETKNKDNKREGDKDQRKEKRHDKGREPFDPMREAEMLAKMIQKKGGGPEGPVGMDEIKMAFKALEMAADNKAAGAAAKKDSGGPLIWTWHDPCERWRWRNFEAGVHLVGPGGWEERDWKVFADDRGCDEFDEEEKWAEEDERDIFDWSC